VTQTPKSYGISPVVRERSHQITVRKHNLATVLQLIVSGGPISRAEITRLAGTASGTTTKLTSALIEAGIVREVTAAGPGSGFGRPRVPLDLDASRRAVLTLHIGVHYSVVAAVDLRAQRIVNRVIEHPDARDPIGVVRTASEALSTLRAELADRRVLGVGITSGGTVEHTTGRLIHHPDLGWESVPVRDLVADRLDLPVVFDNEARGEALTELTFGVGAELDNLITLFVGSVVEAAVVFNRQIHRGATGLAGRVTHLPVADVRGPRCDCGRRNCLRVVASNTGLLAQAQERGIAGPATTFDDLLERSRDGDRVVMKLLDVRARRVGEAVGTLVDLLDPQAVTLSGNASYADGYLDAVRSGMRTADPDRRTGIVRLATFGEHSTAAAAASLLLTRYFNDPAEFEPLLSRTPID
jgi:predicted NBD/HSP70 family sugar kinase